MDNSIFSRLPLEVRELIYQDIFNCIAIDSVSEKWSVINIRSKENPWKDPWKSKKHRPCRVWSASQSLSALYEPYPASIFLLCRQICEEASHVYWNRRILSFVIDSSDGLFKRVYNTVDRIAAICCIRDFLINLATRQPFAVRGLAKINVKVHGFSKGDMSEVHDILHQTQMILSNWRSPKSAIVPIYLQINEVLDLKPLPGHRHSLEPKTVDFNLPVHDATAWREEVRRGMQVARLNFELVKADYDVQWSNWCLELLEWCWLNFSGDQRGCSLQRGCHCERHAGRNQLALDFEAARKRRVEMT